MNKQIIVDILKIAVFIAAIFYLETIAIQEFNLSSSALLTTFFMTPVQQIGMVGAAIALIALVMIYVNPKMISPITKFGFTIASIVVILTGLIFVYKTNFVLLPLGIGIVFTFIGIAFVYRSLGKKLFG